MRLSCVLCGVLMTTVGVWIGGCAASYRVPGAAADFRALGITADEQAARTDADIARRLARKPAAGFPAAIAAVRVQDESYSSYSYHGSRAPGRFSVVTLRDVESDEQFDRLAKLPMVRGVAPLNRLVIDDRINTERDLRAAAAELQADIVLIYTFDTRFGSKTVVPVLGTITLGVFPSEEAQVTSTASAAMIDTRTGYIYGLSEATAKATQAANLWTTSDAVEDSRLRAEREAFEKLIGQLERTWTQVAATYGPGRMETPVVQTLTGP